MQSSRPRAPDDVARGGLRAGPRSPRPDDASGPRPCLTAGGVDRPSRAGRAHPREDAPMTTTAQPAAASPDPTADVDTGAPPRAGAVLATLIIIAAVANLP